MPHSYTEDNLVERPTIQLFAELEWATVSAMEEDFGRGGTLGRETKSEVVSVSRLRAALERLNPALPADSIKSTMDELARNRSATIWLRRTASLGSAADQGVDSQLRPPLLG